MFVVACSLVAPTTSMPARRDHVSSSEIHRRKNRSRIVKRQIVPGDRRKTSKRAVGCFARQLSPSMKKVAEERRRNHCPSVCFSPRVACSFAVERDRDFSRFSRYRTRRNVVRPYIDRRRATSRR